MISIIMPVYNVAPYLKPCMDSILCQSYRDFELILVDDGSTDGSGSICDAYAEQDPRVRVFHQQNAGAAAARNCGTMAAKGEYLTYIDGDDMVSPSYLSCLWNAMEKTGADISVCDCRYFQDTPPEKAASDGAVQVISGREACAQIVNLHRTGMIVIWGKLYSRSLREHLIMPAGKRFEDEFVCYRLMYSARTVAMTSCVAYYYRQREGSISRETFSLRSLDKLEALSGAVDWLHEKGDRELEGFARKRYLLSIEIHWRKAKTEGGEKRVLKRLREEHQRCYREYGREIRACCTWLERMTLFIFLVSPHLYCLISGVYAALLGLQAKAMEE